MNNQQNYWPLLIALFSYTVNIPIAILLFILDYYLAAQIVVAIGTIVIWGCAIYICRKKPNS